MVENALPPISADSLRARDEWRNAFPGAAVVWEEAADEGVGVGFDGLDPSAMMRAYLRTEASWAEVLAWYRRRLAALGWLEDEIKAGSWFEWTSSDHPFERILVMDRGRQAPAGTLILGWVVPAELGDTTMFEVMYLAQTAAQPRTRGRA
jgi:hypothetical protein